MLAASFAARAQAQPVPVPGAAAPAAPVAVVPAAGPAGVAVAPVAVAPRNLFSFFCPTPEQLAYCKAKFCNCALGQFLNNGLKPVGEFSGGIVGDCCPSLRLIDLAKPADSAEGAAARIKADEADAKARREAVRYLGTVDCAYWPEARDALINALRADRNECVRLEAAWALARGCCCTKATIKALMLTVSGGAEDGNPVERSDRVRAAAHAALAHCLACYCDEEYAEPVPEGEGEKKPGEPKPGLPEELPPPLTRAKPVEYYRRAESMKREQLIEEARRTLERRTPLTAAAAQPMAGRSLVDLVNYAAGGHGLATAPAPVAVEKRVVEKPVVEKAVAPPAVTTKPPFTDKPVVEKAIAPAAVTTKPFTEKPAVPPLPVGKTAGPQAPQPVPVTLAAPVPTAAPVAYPPSPSRITSVAHRDSPAPPKAAPEGMPHLGAPELPSAPAPTGAPASVAYMSVLQGSRSSEQREWAAESLAEFDGWTNPRVVDALVKASRGDESPVVRATCLRSLARLNVQSAPVLATVREALKDGDPHVRAEAEQTLRRLSAENPDSAAPPKPSAKPR
jgi:hypothetical protein